MVNPVTKEQVLKLVNARINRVLLVAQASLEGDRYAAYRKIVLNEFGESGLGKELERLFNGPPLRRAR